MVEIVSLNGSLVIVGVNSLRISYPQVFDFEPDFESIDHNELDKVHGWLTFKCAVTDSAQPGIALQTSYELACSAQLSRIDLLYDY